MKVLLAPQRGNPNSAPYLFAHAPPSADQPGQSFGYCSRRLETLTDQQCCRCFRNHEQLHAAFRDHAACTQAHLIHPTDFIPCPNCTATMHFVPPAKSDQTNPLLPWAGCWCCSACGDAVDVRLAQEAMPGHSEPAISGHDQSGADRDVQKEAQHRQEIERRKRRLGRLTSPYQQRPY